MVYCGKPSKGCGPCRAKRTKCDQARPSCGQCRRAPRECFGYRDAHEIVFRNETSKIVNRVKAETACENSRLVSATSPVRRFRNDGIANSLTDFSLAPTQTVKRTTLAVRNLSVPLEDEATSYFFHAFVSKDASVPLSHGSINAYHHVLPTLHRQDSSFGVLPSIIEAIGLASISNVKRSPQLMVVAGQRYARALRAINVAIQDSTKASTDQTLTAVMLLGMFETVTCSNPESLRSWGNHISGAIAIARLRGPDQVRTDIGRTIFATLRMQICMHCLQRHLIVPPEFIEWAEMVAETETEDTRPEYQLFPIIGRLCALRVNLENTRDIRVLSLANCIDSDLEDWKNSLPPSFSYSSVQSDDTDHVFSDTYHVYSNRWAVVSWCGYRCARIFTNQIILNWLNRNPIPNHALERYHRHQSGVRLADLSHSICASAPFILGTSQSSTYSSRPSSSVTAAVALLWPLYLAAAMEQQVSGRRAWIITRLEMIGRTMGIKQAESLAKVLRVQKEVTAWDKFEKVRADEGLDEW